ncbi:MAG: hypothetical protein AVDCRST_MAG68-5686 [uncultured Gemmatimonadetes bacterium]|uniref:Uncharacterized protein n=1 Tax=uncultured Gemmatimonadota bacterium TaxID=203437 RepID=A0A6J4MXI7_9BACT|nr:MAG: hypothetical protein AVDCRST_MAG68-5686 [uncultured Gemmatimonadota bacterium]
MQDAEWFGEFLALLTEKMRARDLLRVYRGNHAGYIRGLLHRSARGPDEGETRERLFLFGVKARRYHTGGGQYPDARDYLSSVNDTSDEVLAFLFDRVAAACVHPRRRSFVGMHCSTAFLTYFENASNRDHFVRVVGSLTGRSRLRVRDYYLYFAHTAGQPGVSAGSPLVSTSMRPDTGRQFARGYQGRNLEPWVIHYFIPRPFENFAVLPWHSTNADDQVRSVGLPSPPLFGLFPAQQEVAVKGALLPHFIIGVRDLTSDQFVPNPHLFVNHGLVPDEICEHGIPIDQSRFTDTIFDTGYGGFLEAERTGDFRDFSVADRSR